MIVYEGRVEKVASIEKSKYPRSGIGIGQFEEGRFLALPVVGERFSLHSHSDPCGGIWTSEVKDARIFLIDVLEHKVEGVEAPISMKEGEILFITENSVYRLSDLKKFER